MAIFRTAPGKRSHDPLTQEEKQSLAKVKSLTERLGGIFEMYQASDHRRVFRELRGANGPEECYSSDYWAVRSNSVGRIVFFPTFLNDKVFGEKAVPQGLNRSDISHINKCFPYRKNG